MRLMNQRHFSLHSVCVCEERQSIAYTIKPPRGMQRFPIAATLSTSNSRHQQNLLARAWTGRAEGKRSQQFPTSTAAMKADRRPAYLSPPAELLQALIISSPIDCRPITSIT